MAGLRIAPGLHLPADVAGEAIAILAKRGAGKTNTGRVLVGGAKWRLLEQLTGIYPESFSKDELADRAGASATSSSFTNNLGALRTLGLIDYPTPGRVAALPVLMLEA